MATKNQTNGKTRVIQVTMKFYKVFNIEVPEGVTEEDVLESGIVDDESHSCFGEATLELDETSTDDLGHKTPTEIASIQRHEKVFSWEELERA